MWVQLALWAVTTLISYFLAPKPQQPTIAPGQIEAPVASEDKPIPVLFGTRVIKGANVVWYGDLRVVPIRKKGGKK